MKCPNCKSTIPDESNFCLKCGASIEQQTDTASVPHHLNTFDPNSDLQEQLINSFLVALEMRIEEEHHIRQHKAYFNQLHKSGFYETVELRAGQLAKEIKQNNYSDKVIKQLVDDSFEGLLDYFIIHFCKAINKTYLPDTILKYESAQLKNVDLFRLIMDYLDFAREKETLYTDFLHMPAKKLRTASQSFLFAKKEERIFFICDHSFFGSCKEGFAMTDQAAYWRVQLQEPVRVAYADIQTVKRLQKWITINDHFFSSRASLNLKVFKLMKKLQRLYTTNP